MNGKGKRIAAFFTALVLLAAFVGPSVRADEPKDDRIGVVVMDLEAIGVNEDDARVISNKIRIYIFQTGKYRLVDRKMMDKAIDELKLPQTGLSDKELVKLGDFLQAQKIISGSFQKMAMDNTYIISLKMIDIKTATIENMVEEECEGCTSSELFGKSKSVVDKLLGPKLIPPPPPPKPDTKPDPDPYRPPKDNRGVPEPPPQSDPRQLYMQAGGEQDINKRVTLYEQALQLDPNLAVAHNDLAVDLLDLNRVQEAIYHLQNALRINPNDAVAHNTLGTAYQLSGRLEDAAAEYRKALQINPNYAVARSNLGKVYLDQGNWNAALNEFERARQLEPNNADHYFNLGCAQMMLSNYTESAQSYLKCVGIDPEYIDAYYNLGDVYQTVGDKQSAIYYFEKYISKEKRPGEQVWADRARDRVRQLRSGGSYTPL